MLNEAKVSRGKSHIYHWIGAIALAATALQVVPLAAQENCSIGGSRITIVIGFPAGSSDDLAARQIQPYLQKHLPGNPTVVIENRPGAGGLLAANAFYATAPNNGTTIGMLTGFALPYALKDSSILFDIDKMGLLGVQPTNQVTLVANSTGITKPADLLSVTEPLLIGTSSRDSAPFVANVLMLDLLGVPHKDLTGYQGQGEILQAIRTNELNVAPLAWDRYMATRESLASEGIMNAIWQRGYLDGDGTITAEPALEMPTQAEIIAELKPEAVETPEYRAMNAFIGLFGVTRSYWLPPATSECLTDVWRVALASAYSDPEYVAVVKKETKMDPILYNSTEGRDLFTAIFDSFADPEIASVINSIIED